MKLRQSYVHGVSDVHLRGETLGENFDNTVKKFANHEALVVRHQQIRWTYKELQEKVNQFAAGLLALGLKPGDRIGIWSPNNSEWVIAQFATAKIGLILVNINPAYQLAELEYALNTVEAKALIFMSAFRTSNYCAMLHEIAPEIDDCRPGALMSRRLPHLKILIQIGGQAQRGVFDFLEIPMLADGDDAVTKVLNVQQSLQFDDPINIQFTSGTTGSPKGATLSHFNILNNGFFIGEAMGLSEQDRLCIPVPLYHCFGMVLGNLSCTTHGSTMVFPSEGFDPLAVLETIEDEQCTALHGVPTMFIAALDHPRFKDFTFSSLRTGIMAGASCPVEIMKRVISEMHLSEITIAYGMTETSPVSFQSSTTDPLDKRVTTVGRVHPHVEAKVIDLAGRIVPPGTKGELLTRGYLVMQGYWGDEKRTMEVIDNTGWMHTGDLATFDEEGYCSIVGRLTDMVIRGGENIYPREIEELLYSHPKIQDVQVFGVPDSKYGEELCAWIILHEGENTNEDEIKKFCQGKISHFKIPRHIRFVDEYPMTVTGKIRKFIMRKQMAEELRKIKT